MAKKTVTIAEVKAAALADMKKGFAKMCAGVTKAKTAFAIEDEAGMFCMSAKTEKLIDKLIDQEGENS